MSSCFATVRVEQAFGKVFETTPDDLDMHVIYDVSHNIAKASGGFWALRLGFEWLLRFNAFLGPSFASEPRLCVKV